MLSSSSFIYQIAAKQTKSMISVFFHMSNSVQTIALICVLLLQALKARKEVNQMPFIWTEYLPTVVIWILYLLIALSGVASIL